MNLFLLKREEYDYDEYIEMLVRAPNEARAREIANENTGDEGKLWTDPNEVTCERVSVQGVEGSILRSFNAG